MIKEDVEKYLKENEMNIQHGKAAFVYAGLIYDSYVDSNKIHGVNYTPVFSYFFKSDSANFYQIIPQEHIRNVSEKIYLDYCKNPKTLEDKIKKHEYLNKQLDKFWKNYQNKKNNLTDKELFKAHKNFTGVFKEWWHYGVIGEDKGEVINWEVVPRFAKRHNLSLDKAKEIMIVLAHPDSQAVFNLERQDFLNICLEVKKSKSNKLNRLIGNYIKNYFYFKTDFYEANEITSEYLLEQAQKEKGDILKEIKSIDDSFSKIQEEKERLIKDLKLTKEDKGDIYFSQRITEWFDKRKIGTMVQCYYLYSLLKEVAKRYNIQYHDLTFSTYRELEEFLRGGKLNKAEIRKRNGGVFYVFEKNKYSQMFYGEDGKKMLQMALRTGGEEIEGQVASTGKLKEISGVARVISNPNSDEFNQGDILITSMTRIEFVPLMRKAKAIITDEGGIVCHAAIVSRELEIPCIIGTKTATRMLKTGDKIKMDLVKGVISKI
jgi:phosphohistidine swiveling domain-containing protein